ncbi:hypothetical protein Ddc_00950 [Ditylenchus destructor]|nr:hypothetical protein Ddc_00950 [Ditylenchus destructor]
MDTDTPQGNTAALSSLIAKPENLYKRSALKYENASTYSLERKWCTLFTEYILGNIHCNTVDCTARSDDMIWYVPMVRIASTAAISAGTSHLQVFRRQSKNKPVPGDSNINWEETVCLNVILQQLDYYVTCAVCSKTTPHNLQILRKNCQTVYPSPSRRRMDAKGECEEITYPKIYFAIDNFDQVFNDVIVQEGECVCVELVCHDRYRSAEAVIFLGSIRYDVLKKLYDSRSSGTWNWAQKLITSSKRCYEFVKMRGPRGKGFAEMAIARVASCGFETPMSENGFDFRTDIIPQLSNQRRMSDTNIFNRLLQGNRRSAMTPGPNPQTSTTPTPSSRNQRWQSDAENANHFSDFDAKSITGVDQTMSNSTASRWSVRGIGLNGPLNFLRDKPESLPLNAFLTYVTLPWISILEDILMPTNRRPILTFDLDFLPQQN